MTEIIEIRLDGENQLDEIVGTKVNFHLEQMSDNAWWISITDTTGRVNVRLFARRAKIYGSYEDERKEGQ